MTIRSEVISSTIDRSRHTVLVVDDNPVTCYATARVIRAAGFATQEVGTGGEALRMAAMGVSALVLDVHLPDIDGFEVCRRLRADPATSALPVIHLSAAYVQSEDKVTGLNAGADAYLVHPVEPAVLIATLQALVRARMAEEKLRSSEMRFRTIYNQAPSGMALIDDAGRLQDVNPALMQLLGHSREALVGRFLFDFAPAAYQDLVRQRVAGTLAGDAAWQGEFPLLRADGRAVHLAWSVSSHAEPGLRIGVATDVSERKELEAQRAEMLQREQVARQAAERHSRTKDDFVAILSHELRTPLNAIAGWVHLLNRHGTSPERVSRALDAIDRSVKAQSRIISDILDVSRVNAGKLQLFRERVDPAALTAQSIEALSASIEAKQIDVQLEQHGEVSPTLLDPTRFQQIVWNLLTNAIKFSNERGTIRVGLAWSGQTLSLTVEDEGKGVAAEFLPYLFDRFSQSDSPGNRLHGGLGLGLSIVQHLVQLHGGSVHATSPGEGLGTRMQVDLPLVAVEPEAVIDTSARPAPAAFERPLAQIDIVVVEDNQDAADMLAVILRDAGAQVRSASSYDDALSAFDDRWPDILVSDIGLPGRDGYALIETLRAASAAAAGAGSGKALAAVALTAFSRPEDRHRALQSGFDAFLTKPLQPHALVAAITALVRSLPSRA